MSDSPIAEKPSISATPRRQAIADGVLIDATVGDFSDVTREHFKYLPVAMTAQVFSILERAVANRRHHNSYAGIWHDICFMLRVMLNNPANRARSEFCFRVIITGAGRNKYWTLKAAMGDDGDGEACLTILMPEEK
jgi:hypothetical protein